MEFSQQGYDIRNLLKSVFQTALYILIRLRCGIRL